MYVNQESVGVYMGAGDGSQKQVIHLLYSDGGAIHGGISFQVVRVWGRRTHALSSRYLHFNLLEVPPDVVEWVSHVSNALYRKLKQIPLPQHRRKQLQQQPEQQQQQQQDPSTPQQLR